MTLEPFLFSTDPAVLDALTDATRPDAERATVVVVDWERRGKPERQAGATDRIGIDTQIGTDSADDLARARRTTDAHIICRVNGPDTVDRDEVDLAVELGADEVLLPMVRTPADVERALDLVAGRAGLGVMVETSDAVTNITAIDRLPITRVYVGLMDLALDRRTPSIFAALVDGTVEHVRDRVSVPFGFGGLTVAGRGVPLPVGLLLGEMARLRCDFTFLRRSFIADTAGADRAAALAALRQSIQVAFMRDSEEIERDRLALLDSVNDLLGTHRTTGVVS